MNQGRKKTGQSETVALFVPEKEVDQTQNLYLSCMEEIILAREKYGRNGAEIMGKI